MNPPAPDLILAEPRIKDFAWNSASRRDDAPEVEQIKVRQLFISQGHNYFGHHGRPAGRNAILEVPEIECLAKRGIRGDRFLDHKENYKGQITFFAMEVFRAISNELSVWDKPASVFRRNLITEGADLNGLIGVEFEIQGVCFRGSEECKPCYWMDQAFAPGAEEFLRGRGGLRAVILMDGKLRVDPLGR